MNTTQGGYFFLMIMMYCLASLPLIYVYSFSPKSELIGFINYFVVNVVFCFLDMVLAFIALFSQGNSTTVTHVSKLATMTANIRWLVLILFPSVNLKRGLFNIRLKSNPDCVASLNSLMFTNYSSTQPWMSLREPGVGIQFVIFCVQMAFWWLILTLIENGSNIKLAWRRCCGCNDDLEQIDDENEWNDENGTMPKARKQWDDAVC
jgi:hypothetical protein